MAIRLNKALDTQDPALFSCEDAEDRGLAGSLAARLVADLPKRLGLRIGVR